MAGFHKVGRLDHEAIAGAEGIILCYTDLLPDHGPLEILPRFERGLPQKLQ